MKRLFTFATLLFAFAMNMLAEKTIYIPLSWAYDASTQEYTEDGDANKQWSFNRSKQSENCIVFWQKGFGSDPAKAPSLQGVDMTVDIDAVLRVAENCYNLNINIVLINTFDSMQPIGISIWYGILVLLLLPSIT